MTKKLRELILNAPIKRSGIFSNFLIYSNGKYNGSFGVNGYNSILLFGFDTELNKYVKITDYADVFTLFDLINGCSFYVDILTDYGIPRVWFSYPVAINNSLDLSTIQGKLMKKEHTK